MDESRGLFVTVGGGVTSFPPTAMPSTASRSEFQTVQVKFTLMGLPNDIPRITDFRAAALGYVKGMLSSLANDIQELKITNVKELYIDTIMNQRRDLATTDYNYEEPNFEHNRVFNLYYDVVLVRENPGQLYGPLLISAVRSRHDEILQNLQQYKPVQYYYTEDFDLCTPSSGRRTRNDSQFDLCSQNHQLISIKFGVLALPKGVSRYLFKKGIMDMYRSFLSEIDGLQITGLYDGHMEEDGNMVDFYYKVNAIRKTRDMELVVANRLNSQEGKVDILHRLQSYTDEEGRSIEWCLTETGRYSTEPCTSIEANMPMWAIATVTIVSVLAVLLASWACIVAYQRSREEDYFKHTIRKYVADPDDVYKSQISSGCIDDPPRKHPKSRIRGYRRTIFRPSRQDSNRYDRRRHRHYHKQRSRHHRRSDKKERKETRRLKDIEHNSGETAPECGDEYQMVVYRGPTSPQNHKQRRELPQLPPPPPPQQHQMLQIEAQHPVPTRRFSESTSARKRMRRIEAQRQSLTHLAQFPCPPMLQRCQSDPMLYIERDRVHLK